MKKFLAWLFSDWHVSRTLVVFYTVTYLWFRPTLEGFILANVLYHMTMPTLFGVLLAFDSLQRRYTKRSFMNNR